MDKYSLIPFLAAIKPPGDHSSTTRVSIQRVAEAILIAVLTAGMAMYATQQVIKTELAGVKKDVSRIEQTVDDIRRDLYRPVIEAKK